jgi:hypothetical protein
MDPLISIWQDIFEGLFLGLTEEEIFTPFGFILWMGFMLLNLKHIDLSDSVPALLYLIYGLFMGTILVILIPKKAEGDIAMRTILQWFLIFSFFLGSKWFYEWNKQRRLKDEKGSNHV